MNHISRWQVLIRPFFLLEHVLLPMLKQYVYRRGKIAILDVSGYFLLIKQGKDGSGDLWLLRDEEASAQVFEGLNRH
jgi:hypothetical protein